MNRLLGKTPLILFGCLLYWSSMGPSSAISQELPPADKLQAIKLFEVDSYCEGVVFDHNGRGYISWSDTITQFELDGSNKFFAKTDIPRLKRQLVQQICAGSGGPCKYTGRSMKDAHRGMGVANADFNALVEDLVKSLDKYKVPKREKGELLAILGPMRRDIVEKR